MTRDHPIIEQVRRARREIAARSGDTVDGLVEYYRLREQTAYADRAFVGGRTAPSAPSGQAAGRGAEPPPSDAPR